jgi:hypothetical protein
LNALAMARSYRSGKRLQCDFPAIGAERFVAPSSLPAGAGISVAISRFGVSDSA